MNIFVYSQDINANLLCGFAAIVGLANFGCGRRLDNETGSAMAKADKVELASLSVQSCIVQLGANVLMAVISAI